MGTIYLAWDPRLERDVALKLLREGVDSEELLERFSREARSAARLRHPHIVTIFDVGEHENQPYIAMEYISGHSLSELIRNSAPLSVSRKIELLEELCSGLGYAHRQGIVHRDIKPANLMVDSEGALKILDFGIARVSESMMTQSGVLIGTVNYMSPEQVAGDVVDPRSDIFAVAAVAYELFACRMAFPGTVQTGILYRIMHAEPEPLGSLCPWLDPDVLRIVDKGLTKNPASRYQDLKTMRADLIRARRNLSEESATSTEIPRSESSKPPSAGPSTPARSRELKELERKRQTQLQHWIDEAVRLLADENHAAAITALENALLLDANDSRALALYMDARSRLDAQQARSLTAEAEAHLERGALTLAEDLLERAMTLSPASPDAARVRAAVAAERRRRDEERRVREAVDATLAEATRLLGEQAFEPALAALERLRELAPGHAEGDALRRRAREALEEQRRSRELARAREAVAGARADFTAGRHEAAIAALEAFTPVHELVTATLDQLKQELATLRERARVRREQLAVARQAIDAGDTDAAERALQTAENVGAPADEVHTLRLEVTRIREAAIQRAAREREEQERRAAASGLVRRAAETKHHLQAIEMLREAVLTDPTLVEAADALALRETAHAAQEAAETEARRRREEARRLVGTAARERNHDAALIMLREAAALDPEFADAPQALRAREGQQAAAIAAAKEERRRQEAAAERKRQAVEAERRAELRAADKRREAAEAARQAAAAAEQSRQQQQATVQVERAAGVEPRVAIATGAEERAHDERAIVRRFVPHTNRIAAVGAGVALLVVTGLVWRDLGKNQESQPLPMPSVTTVPSTASVPPAESRPVSVEKPPPAALTTVPDDAAVEKSSQRATELRRQAEVLLQRQPPQALQLAGRALQLQPADPASRELVHRIAVQARERADEARGKAAGRTASTTFTEAQNASDLAERQFKQGHFEDAAKSWFDARAGFDQAAAQPLQVAAAPTPSIPAPPIRPSAPQPPAETTTVPPAPATSTVPTDVTSAAPATPPTSVQPVPTAPAAVRNDQASIQTTLALYADAYSRLDPNGVTAVFPDVDVSAIRNAFSGLRALRMTIESPQTSVSGDTAVVTCTIQQDFTPRVGREEKQRTPARFELKRTGDRWLIVNRR